MNALIVKRVYSDDGDDIDLYLVETGGYGASWTKRMDEAKIFSSKASAERHIAAAILHNAKATLTTIGHCDLSDRD